MAGANSPFPLASSRALRARSVNAGGGRVANQQPATTNTKPITVVVVINSSRNTAPSATATTGLANVMRRQISEPAIGQERGGGIADDDDQHLYHTPPTAASPELLRLTTAAPRKGRKSSNASLLYRECDQAVIRAPSMPASGLSPGKKPRWLGKTSSGDWASAAIRSTAA